MESLEDFGGKYKGKRDTTTTSTTTGTTTRSKKDKYVEEFEDKQNKEEIELEYLKKLYNNN
jgi:hypothetical protein